MLFRTLRTLPLQQLLLHAAYVPPANCRLQYQLVLLRLGLSGSAPCRSAALVRSGISPRTLSAALANAHVAQAAGLSEAWAHSKACMRNRRRCRRSFVVLSAYFVYHKLTETATQLAALYACFPFGSAAALWFENSVNSMANIDDFEAQFRTRFHLHIADRTKYLHKLESFHQRSNDSVISFYSLMTETYDNLQQLDMTFHEDQIKMKFITGLRPELRAVVLTQESIEPLTIQKALTIAMNHERNLPRGAAPRAPGLAAAGGPAVQGPPNPSVPANSKCNYCKQHGHYFASCPKVAAKKAAGTWQDRQRK